MGSRYQSCTIQFEEEWISRFPEFQINQWQDIYAQSNDRRYTALVKWNNVNNTPGFEIIIIDNLDQSLKTSRHINGCCDAIRWEVNHFLWSAWPQGKGEMLLDGSLITK